MKLGGVARACVCGNGTNPKPQTPFTHRFTLSPHFVLDWYVQRITPHLYPPCNTLASLCSVARRALTLLRTLAQVLQSNHHYGSRGGVRDFQSVWGIMMVSPWRMAHVISDQSVSQLDTNEL